MKKIIATILLMGSVVYAGDLDHLIYADTTELPGPMQLAALADEVVAANPLVIAQAGSLGADIGIPVTSTSSAGSPGVAVVPVSGGGAAVMVDPAKVKENGFFATIKKNPGKSLLALAGIARIVYDNRVKLGLSSPDEPVGAVSGSTSTTTSADQQGDNDGVDIEISGNSAPVSVTIIKESPSADVDDKATTGSQTRFDSDDSGSP